MIEVANAIKRYGPVEAVKGLTFSVDQGEILGLLGPNGAGKTTLLKILTGYHYPSEGKATIDGLDSVDDSLDVRSRVGYLPETAPLYGDLLVSEYLDFIADVRNLTGTMRIDRISYVVRECGLEKVFYQPIDSLSKGYRQRVGLAQAIIHDPQILILDEPTTGLDPNQILEIRSLIKRFGKEKTVILSTHILQEVEAVCDRVVILNEGRIVAQGTAEEIRRELKGETSVELLLKGGPSLPAAEVLEKNDLVERAETLSGQDGLQVVTVWLEGEDKTEALFDLLVEKGYKILKMVPSVISLEEIFRQLTAEGGRSHE